MRRDAAAAPSFDSWLKTARASIRKTSRAARPWISHPAEVTHDQRELLSAKLSDFRADSVSGSGQYIQEEQPHAVMEAVARLNEAAR